MRSPLFIFAVLYALASGPATWLYYHGYLPQELLQVIFAPLSLACDLQAAKRPCVSVQWVLHALAVRPHEAQPGRAPAHRRLPRGS